MKLIKLTDDHYVIVDESDIKEGNWFYNPATKQVLYASKDMLFWNSDTSQEHKGWKKITHSTQPLYKNDFWSIRELKLSEVKELIGDVDETEWEVEWETIDNRQPCHCQCHNNPDMIHFVACCNNGWIGKVTQKLKLK